MKAVRHLLALVAMALAAATVSAQFVKGNEAVKVMPDGTKKVETPPVPAPGPASKSNGTWLKPRPVYANAQSRSRDPRPVVNRHMGRRSSRAFGSQRRARPGSGASTPTWPGSAWTCTHAPH